MHVSVSKSSMVLKTHDEIQIKWDYIFPSIFDDTTDCAWRNRVMDPKSNLKNHKTNAERVRTNFPYSEIRNLKKCILSKKKKGME